MDTAYSHRSLAQKLGIKENQPIIILNNPPHFLTLLSPLPPGCTVLGTLHPHASFIHFFSTEEGQLKHVFPTLRHSLAANGSLWISWPKKHAAILTDITEQTVMTAGFANGLIDVKVCAIDNNWSAMKFVFRLKDRH